MTVKKIISIAALFAAPGLFGQDISNLTSFRILGKNVQMHGFLSQGYVKTEGNNWLTMKSNEGSFAMTDGGVNISAQLTDKFRVGAQVYDRNLGELGRWHPLLDWATADYKFASWFGVRAGKVKTVLGLFTDSQDVDFLHVFALLPQSIYMTDMRDSTAAHLGADVYGDISLKKLGGLSYTVYGGKRRDSKYGGYPYLIANAVNVRYTTFGGPQYGADLRWKTPVTGLLVGASRLNEEITASGFNQLTKAPVSKRSVTEDFTNHFYGEYAVGNLKLDAEFRRSWQNHLSGPSSIKIDTRGWYVSGAYRLSRRIELGSYYSRYVSFWSIGTQATVNNPDLPNHHINDKVVTARLDLTNHWNLKVEGHFMDGYGGSVYPSGFYAVNNPGGMKPQTNALIVRTGWNF